MHFTNKGETRMLNKVVARRECIISEETSLLLHRTPSIVLHREQKEDQGSQSKILCKFVVNHVRRTLFGGGVGFFCTLLACVFVVLLMASIPLWNIFYAIPLDLGCYVLTVSSPISNDCLHGSTSLQSLARKTVLPLYLTTLKHSVPTLTESMQPADVYRCRKALLKTRDSLDIFSVVYPNTSISEDNSLIDRWETIRNLLDVGYTVIGEFQDLDHAHINFTNEMLKRSRAKVVQWKRDFDEFHKGGQLKVILQFIGRPSEESFRHRESRLFWKKHADVPAGRDCAAGSLASLILTQIATSLSLFKRVKRFDSVLESTVHDHFHSLRKEIRCLTDEYDLFGAIVFPEGCNAIISLLRRARQYLGDINDSWTAFDTYSRTGMFAAERSRLPLQIEEAWHTFRIWADKVDFEGALRNLTKCLHQEFGLPAQEKESDSESRTFPSLQEFLLLRRKSPTCRLVIGNEAGDADSIVSAITLAYIESEKQGDDKTPVVSITKSDFLQRRPEVKLLMQFAGINTTSLIFFDDPFVENVQVAYLTLTDHNLLAPTFQERGNWTVVEIVDHHQDEAHYLDTSADDARTIAFANGTASVASSCTLVAERLFAVWDRPYPASLSSLLMGVILLDSVGLSPEVGKVSQRDRDAVQGLLEGTAWAELPLESIRALNGSRPDPSMLFNLLQGAKYDYDFWSSISVRDSLKLDYKSFSSTDGYSFGVSSVLMPEDEFFMKKNVLERVLRVMEELNVSFLAIMFASESSAGLRRQLALCGTRQVPLRDVVEYLMESDVKNPEPLSLREKTVDLRLQSHRLSVRVFDQQNVVPSRKQIGPLLAKFFVSSSYTVYSTAELSPMPNV